MRCTMSKVEYIEKFNLAETQARLNENLKKAQKDLQDFNKYLEERYTQRAQQVLNDSGKDFGTANLLEGNTQVKVELRKKVAWDQEGLIKYLNTLKPEDADHLSKVSVTVPESKYSNALPAIQHELKKFRTVSLQGVKVTFEGEE